jgi:type IV secretory pathway VirB4 component
MASLTKNAKTTQDFLPIREIRDGVAVLKNGGLRLVLICSSLNFSLKSPDEQQALIFQYQNFLNSLDFHVQIFIQSRKLNIQPYLMVLEKRLTEQNNELIKIQTKEYIEFIKKFTETVNVMAKSFFVVIPYDPLIIDVTRGGLLNRFRGGSKQSAEQVKKDNFEESKTQLEQRTSVVEQGLARVGVRTAPLGTEELVELYFKIFNPGENEVPILE